MTLKEDAWTMQSICGVVQIAHRNFSNFWRGSGVHQVDLSISWSVRWTNHNWTAQPSSHALDTCSCKYKGHCGSEPCFMWDNARLHMLWKHGVTCPGQVVRATRHPTRIPTHLSLYNTTSYGYCPIFAPGLHSMNSLTIVTSKVPDDVQI